VGHEEQTATLYDFLYRDPGRLASYYAQIFGGHLSAVEETDSERSAKAKGGKAGLLPVASVEGTLTEEVLSSSRRTFTPHDLISIDVLTALIRGDRITTQFTEAPHGALIRVEGTVLFIDRHMLELAGGLLGAVAGALPAGGEGVDVLKMLEKLFASLTVPSAFMIQTNDGRKVVGTLKDGGMEEPISAYYFKHGPAGLSGVHLIGIKESPAPAINLPQQSLMGAGQGLAQVLSDLTFDKQAIRVTPVAMFRKL
jgi:hypothetical protein